MIYKSFLVEDNIDLLKNKLVLFYGENLGLLNDLKNKIKLKNKTTKIIRTNQEEVLKNENIIFNEIMNASLFEEKKYIFIDNVNDKIIKLIEEVQPKIDKNKIFLFGSILDKKSKLRVYFEKNNGCDVVPCYKDNELNIKKLIIYKLKDYSGLTPQIINSLIENSQLDRVKINNEIEKIKTFFSNKIIKSDHLDKILNVRVNEDFDLIKDTALKGNKSTTNKLLSNSIFESERISLYINIINQRLNKLKELKSYQNNKTLSDAINQIKPPVFWKDKPNLLEQAKKWDSKKLSKAISATFNVEVEIKSNSNINKDILIKKLLLDICTIANT